MSAQNTVYLNLREITELHKPDIQVKDVAEIYCSDTHVQNRCASLKIKTIREQKSKRYVETIRQHARDFIAKREAPAVIPNDGKQTPMRGHPVFIAQHATAPPRQALTSWCRHTTEPTVCRSPSAAAPTTTVRTTSRRS